MNKQVVLCVILMLFLAESAFLTFPSLKLDTSASPPKYTVTDQAGLTQVSGIMTENTTWTLAGSPYIVVADVYVDIDIFLTIEPGVTVEFTNGTNLFVDGCLIAQGNSTNIIAFTSNSTSPASGDWGTINIRNYSLGGSIFEHTLVKYASTSLTLAADCNIAASTIEYNDNGISLQNASNIGIENVQITNNSGYGINGSISQSMEIQDSNVSMNGQGANVSSGNSSPVNTPIVDITNSTFDGNTGDAVDVASVNPEIDNCSISSNGGGGVGTSGFPVPYLELWNSNVSNNMGAGVTGVSYMFGSFINVQNCTFSNNTIGIGISGNATNCDINGSSQYGVQIGGSDASLRLDNCTISNSGLDGINVGGYRCSCYVSDCDISNNQNGVNDTTADQTSYMCSVSIYDSSIRNNSNCGITGSGANSLSLQDSLIEQSQYGISGYFSSVGFSGCTIRNTAVGATITGSGLGALSTTIANNTLANIQSSSCTLSYCNIYNSTTNIQCGGSGTLEYCNVYNSNLGVQLGSGTINYCNIFNNTEYNVQDTSSNDVNATYNWWGTINETAIGQGIYDFYDNTTLGRVQWEPYLESAFECDIAVMAVTVTKSVVGRGFPLTINSTVANMGTTSEIFNVTSIANNTIIDNEEVTLESGNSTTITFTWNTSGFMYGNYTISVYANPVSGETNLANNNYTEGPITVSIPGDINGDFKVNLQDLVLLANAYGSRPGDAKWNPNADINGNGVVGLSDLVLLAIHYGQHYP